MPFPSTHWSELTRASLKGETEARQALEGLCRRYWPPLKQFIQRRGCSEAEAEDLTQDFIVHLLEHETLNRAERERGRFRSFLLGALIRFLSDERDRRNALKRGGTQIHVPLEENSETGPALDVAATRAEEVVFDRTWALSILQDAFVRIRQEYAEGGRTEIFELLRRFLPGAAEPPSYEQAAAQLGMHLSAFNSEIHRLRRRFREYVRAEVAATVCSPHEINEEMIHLRHVLLDRGTDFPPWAES